MATFSRAIDASLSSRGMRFGIVAARFNEGIVDRLLEGAVQCLEEHGTKAQDVEVVRVPGAFEIPFALQALAKDRSGGAPDALIALGAVIRGDTPHFDYVSSACTSGCQSVGLETGIPVAFGVLTCDDDAQAEARTGGPLGNKGAEAALAAIEMVDVLRQIEKAR